MANKHVAVIVRGKIAGKRVNWSLQQAKKEKLVGTYWIKWYSGCATRWARIKMNGKPRRRRLGRKESYEAGSFQSLAA